MNDAKLAQELIDEIAKKYNLHGSKDRQWKDKHGNKKRGIKAGEMHKFIDHLEREIKHLGTQLTAERREIRKLESRLGRYNINEAPNSLEGYVFFSEEEMNGMRMRGHDIDKAMELVKKEVLRKFFSSELAHYNELVR